MQREYSETFWRGKRKMPEKNRSWFDHRLLTNLDVRRQRVIFAKF